MQRNSTCKSPEEEAWEKLPMAAALRAGRRQQSLQMGLDVWAAAGQSGTCVPHQQTLSLVPLFQRKVVKPRVPHGWTVHCVPRVVQVEIISSFTHSVTQRH